MLGAWRRRIISALAIATLVAAVAISLFVASDGHGPGVSTFNACLSHKPFLTTTVRLSNHRVVDTIRDRASGSVVGELAMLPTVRARENFSTTRWLPAGSGSANGRFLLLTHSPAGRDAQAMFTCSQTVIPGP